MSPQDAKSIRDSLDDIKNKGESVVTQIAKVAIAVRAIYGLYANVPAFKGLVDGMAKSLRQFKFFDKAVMGSQKLLSKFLSTSAGKQVAWAVGLPAAIKMFAALSLAAGVASYAVGKFFYGQGRRAAELLDMADALNTTAKALQGLKYGAAATKTSFDSVEAAMANIKKTQSEALIGNDAAIADYTRLGISLDDLKNLSPDELFRRIATELKAGGKASQNYSAVLGVMGKESKALVAGMKDGLVDLAEGWQKNGFVISNSVNKSLDDADTKIQKVLASAKGLIRYLSANAAAGGISLAQRAYAFNNLAKAPMRPWELAGAFRGVVDTEADHRLAGDKDFEAGQDLQSKLTQKLQLKQEAADAEAREAAALKKKNDERDKELRLAGMTVKARRDALEAERAGLLNALENERSLLKQQQMRERLLEIEQQIQGDKRRGGSQSGTVIPGDSLARIGLFRGGAGNQQVSILRQQVQLQQRQIQIQQQQLNRLNNAIGALNTINTNLTSDV